MTLDVYSVYGRFFLQHLSFSSSPRTDRWTRVSQSPAVPRIMYGKWGMMRPRSVRPLKHRSTAPKNGICCVWEFLRLPRLQLCVWFRFCFCCCCSRRRLLIETFAFRRGSPPSDRQLCDRTVPDTRFTGNFAIRGTQCKDNETFPGREHEIRTQNDNVWPPNPMEFSRRLVICCGLTLSRAPYKIRYSGS